MRRNKFNLSIISLFAAAALLGVSACGGDEPEPNVDPTPTPTPETSIETVMSDVLTQTSCMNPDEKRLGLLKDIQKYCDACSKADFDAYYIAGAVESSKMESNSILSYYKKSLKRIITEIQTTNVEQGKIVMWHLYNMGYVVKTPSHCFGIDIKHKEAADLVPYLEFLLITHQHVDHYSDAMNGAMKMAGKPVYSNFVENEYKITGKKTFSPVAGIEVVAALGDHSAELKNFCVTYQIDCGADTGNKVIYHIGDTYNATQLAKTKNVDVFIPHSGINMNFTQAMNKIDPAVTLMSHVNELSHAIDNYRWPYSKALDRVKEVAPRKAYVPVWGEKIVL